MEEDNMALIGTYLPPPPYSPHPKPATYACQTSLQQPALIRVLPMCCPLTHHFLDIHILYLPFIRHRCLLHPVIHSFFSPYTPPSRQAHTFLRITTVLNIGWREDIRTARSIEVEEVKDVLENVRHYKSYAFFRNSLRSKSPLRKRSRHRTDEKHSAREKRRHRYDYSCDEDDYRNSKSVRRKHKNDLRSRRRSRSKCLPRSKKNYESSRSESYDSDDIIKVNNGVDINTLRKEKRSCRDEDIKDTAKEDVSSSKQLNDDEKQTRSPPRSSSLRRKAQSMQKRIPKWSWGQESPNRNLVPEWLACPSTTPKTLVQILQFLQEFVESQKNAFHKYFLVNSDIELPVPSTSSFEPCHRPISVEKREEEGESEHQVDEKNSEITEDRENPDKLYNKKNEEINDIALWPDEKPITIVEATSLLKKMNKYETALMTVIWNCILQRINSTNSFIENFRNDYEKVMTEAIDLSGLQSFSEEDEVTFNRRKRNAFFDENKEEYKFTTRDNFKINTFHVVCDSIKTQFLQRVQKYKENEDAIKNKPDNSSNNKDLSFERIYKATKEMSCTFPNIEILLKIFLTIPLSNASGERSFSVLKRIKNYLRSTMGEQKLNNLAVLYIEQEIMNSVDTAKIIDEFARSKAREKFI
ncbi:hypothetical protein HELRODRAFT_171760 [Helobdella robusta]|uniref:HAT C-terminal dimerisation domain-containing protein n=1 Tax=Helobdella robusta TaxID=6412 RepID=T1F4M0_HELRO|nr:hypothetical protein HELRODRAFT_171760 [Helobdella robusta]ESO05368.1 hypothetical protein HELRODRAFT_171760 [Helobdella robusta]